MRSAVDWVMPPELIGSLVRVLLLMGTLDAESVEL